MRKKTKISNGADMDRRLKKPSLKMFLLGMVIVLSGIAVILLWRPRAPEPPVPIRERPVKPVEVVLRSSLAGKWYPADAGTLSKQIEGFFQKAQAESINNVIALILPHAGYQFSGQTAVEGIKAANKKYSRVVVIGPTHYVPMEEVLSVPRVTHYETPLGQIPLDVEFIDELLEHSLFQNVPRAHRYEHSVQIELPLLQYVQKDFKLVPIVAGVCSLKTIKKASGILRSLVDDETLVIASSDFTHFGPNYGYLPFKDNIPEQIKRLDMEAYEYIASSDSDGFLKYKQRTGATICGCVPIAILLSMFSEPVEAHLIKYTTSGELIGDFTNSVSYLSAAFSGTWASNPQIEPQADGSKLTEHDKKQLLTLARKSIIYFLRKRQLPQVFDLDITISDATREPRAAFVTLKRNFQLRGCVGDIFPRRPLYRSVIVNAINAAVNDRRFRPVTEEECSDIAIEISALTAPKIVASPDDIRIGIDGVILNKDGKSAVFLPQVAAEQGWDASKMLTHLSLKAGLAADGWRKGASFLVFGADVFGEPRRSAGDQRGEDK